MPDIIQLLPDSIANQIAAGEVVQRPASAVKELMENAIDAKATHIQLIVKDAGKSLIQVIDNGTGMSATDARMSLERHATSKIRKAEDLFTLRSMGFRGEALASIAAVAQVEIKTRLATEELGTCLVVEASEVKAQEPVATEPGTRISVRNLFYNIPARRNFLKSTPVELRHIIDEFQRLALAHPSVGFMMAHGDEVLIDVPPARLGQRIVSLFGKSYQQQLAPALEQTALVRIHGYIGRPEAARKTRGEQFLFVNQRFIRSHYLHHAVMTAFEGLLPAGSFPFYVLFIDIDPRHIDVNVHPTKTEIKFDDERAVFAVMLSAVRQALGKHNLAPVIDFSNDVNLSSKLAHQTVDTRTYFEERFGTLSQGKTQPGTQPWEQLLEHEGAKNIQPAEETRQQAVLLESKVNQAGSPVSATGEAFFQLHARFILCAVKNGLMIIDQQRAHERVLYEKYMHQWKGTPGASQQSLFPQTLTLGVADFTLLLEMHQELEQMGFRLEVFGKNTVLIRGLPAGASVGERELVEGLLEQFKTNQAEWQIPMRENLARALAKRMGIKAGQALQLGEMKALVANLWSSSNPNFSPDGSPTFFTFDTSKIETYFTR
ncbi:MAG: DNA mismatch repair endonuclease MutL [Cyclobacteriaceae bacterium]|jgi:DNA mismatch repair protein MutL|nr:DNA mismatch repair endonuclease MutL [Cyclobacteriaceae bacterium]